MNVSGTFRGVVKIPIEDKEGKIVEQVWEVTLWVTGDISEFRHIRYQDGSTVPFELVREHWLLMLDKLNPQLERWIGQRMSAGRNN